MNEREQQFAKTFFKTRRYEIPKFFPLKTEGMNRYTPDFYDPRRKVYIEVAGTRQAYFQNLDKYRVFVEEYPDLKFEIRLHTGEIIPEIRWKRGHRKLRGESVYPKVLVNGPEFKRIRLESGIPQWRLAYYAKISLPYIFTIEKSRGPVPRYVVKRLARKLKVRMNELINP